MKKDGGLVKKPLNDIPIFSMDYASLYPTTMKIFLSETEHEKQVRLRNEKIKNIINRMNNGKV